MVGGTAAYGAGRLLQRPRRLLGRLDWQTSLPSSRHRTRRSRPGLARALVRGTVCSNCQRRSACLLIRIPGMGSGSTTGRAAGLGATLWNLASYVCCAASCFDGAPAQRILRRARAPQRHPGLEQSERPARPVLDETLEAKAVPTLAAAHRPLQTSSAHSAFTDIGVLLVGFDPALRRRVWVHALVPGAPPSRRSSATSVVRVDCGG